MAKLRRNFKHKMKQKEVKNYLDKIKPLIVGATAKQLFETCNELAQNPELRKRIEKEINIGLPDGYSFEITSAGFGRLHCPLAVMSNLSPAKGKAKGNKGKVKGNI